MKKAIPLLSLVIALCVVTLGVFLVRNLPTPEPVIQYPQRPPIQYDTQPININTATVEQLMTLPGIGEVYAQRIVDYREAHGFFSSVTELLHVEGIGTTRLEAILDLIVTGGQHEDTGR